MQIDFLNVYSKDIVERNNVQNAEEQNDLVNVPAFSVGSPANPKYVFVGIGLRNARLNFRQQEVTRITLIPSRERS